MTSFIEQTSSNNYDTGNELGNTLSITDYIDEEEILMEEGFMVEEKEDPLEKKKSYQTMIEEWFHNMDKRISRPFLTKYEKTRIVGIRAQQLSRGAIALVDTYGLIRTIDIAEKELLERKLPLMIKRILPGKKYEIWKIDELIF